MELQSSNILRCWNSNVDKVDKNPAEFTHIQTKSTRNASLRRDRINHKQQNADARQKPPCHTSHVAAHPETSPMPWTRLKQGKANTSNETQGVTTSDSKHATHAPHLLLPKDNQDHFCSRIHSTDGFRHRLAGSLANAAPSCP